MEGQEKEEEKKSNFQKHRVKLVLKNAVTLKLIFDLCWTITIIMSSSFKEVKISENHVTIYSRTKLFNTDKKVIANCL